MKKLFYKSIFIIFAGLLVTTPIITDAATFCWGVTDCLWQAIEGGLNYIPILLLTISSLVLMLSGLLFDISIGWLVVGMKGTIDLLPAVFVVWQMLRDIANMFLIFIILYIAIQTILGVGDYKKAMVKVVIVALFINFSLFFTNIMVDASNLLSTIFYKGIVGSENCLGGNTGCLTYRVMSNLGIERAPDRTNESFKNITSMVALGFMARMMSVIVITSTAIVFIVSALIIIKRFITLILAMMSSSLAFASQVLPQTESFWKKWLDKVLKECISTPIYFLYLWIVFKIMESQFLKVDSSLVVALTSGDGSSINFMQTAVLLIMKYVIMIGLLAIAPLVAEYTGASGATWAKSVGDSLNKKIGWKGATRLAKNAGGFTAQTVIGGTANKIAESDKFRRFAIKNPRIADLARKGLKATGEADFGSDNYGYFKGGSSGFDKKITSEKSRINKAQKTDSKIEEYYKATTAYEQAKATLAANPLDPNAIIDEKDTREALEKQTRELGGDILSIKPEILEKNVAHLNKQQLETINKATDEQMSPDDRKKIAKARVTHHKTKITSAGTIAEKNTATKEVGNEILNHDFEDIKNNYALHLSREQMKILKEKLTPTEIGEIYKKRTAPLTAAIVAANPTAIDTEIKKLSAEDFAYLDINHLELIADKLTQPALQAIKDNTAAQPDRTILRDALYISLNMDPRAVAAHGPRPLSKRQENTKKWLEGEGNGEGVDF